MVRNGVRREGRGRCGTVRVIWSLDPFPAPQHLKPLEYPEVFFCVCADRWLGLLDSLSMGTGCQGNQPVIKGMELSASPRKGEWWRLVEFITNGQ